MSLFYRLKISFWFQIPIRQDICEQMHQHLMQVSRSMACIINYYTDIVPNKYVVSKKFDVTLSCKCNKN